MRHMDESWPRPILAGNGRRERIRAADLIHVKDANYSLSYPPDIFDQMIQYTTRFCFLMPNLPDFPAYKNGVPKEAVFVCAVLARTMATDTSTTPLRLRRLCGVRRARRTGEL
jgi:hypothetical protein